MISTRRPISTPNASSLSMAQTTKLATCSPLQPSDSTKLIRLSTSSHVPVTTSARAATKSPPNAALRLVDTQKRVVCWNTRLFCLLLLPSVRLSSFQSILLASRRVPELILCHFFSNPPTTPRTTHNSRRVHNSRCCFSSLPLRCPRCQSLPHLRGHRKLFTRSPTRTPPLGGMDRPLCAGCVYAIAFNHPINYPQAQTSMLTHTSLFHLICATYPAYS